MPLLSPPTPMSAVPTPKRRGKWWSMSSVQFHLLLSSESSFRKSAVLGTDPPLFRPLQLERDTKVTHTGAPLPAVLHHSMAPSPLTGVATGASVGCSQDRGAPPSAQCSCGPRVTATLCSSSSKGLAGLRAPRPARPSIYAAKRLSCGPGAERHDPPLLGCLLEHRNWRGFHKQPEWPAAAHPPVTLQRPIVGIHN
jgi:hypothetical protein